MKVSTKEAIKTLTRRIDHLAARIASTDNPNTKSFDKAEIAALRLAIPLLENLRLENLKQQAGEREIPFDAEAASENNEVPA